MIRIVYIAGRYRHYLPTGEPDWGAMMREVEDEEYWTELVHRCGLMWFAPLANSLSLERKIGLLGDDFLPRDHAIIRTLGEAAPNFHLILMRPGWDDEPQSVGAASEYVVAQESQLIPVHGKAGAEAVSDYLRGLDEYVPEWFRERK